MLLSRKVVTLLGYSQRRDEATRHVRDEHLSSVSVPRAVWDALSFKALEGLDLVEALGTVGYQAGDVQDRHLQGNKTLMTVYPLGRG